MDVLITSQARTGVSTFAFDGGKSIFNYDNQKVYLLINLYNDNNATDHTINFKYLPK